MGRPKSTPEQLAHAKANREAAKAERDATEREQSGEVLMHRDGQEASIHPNSVEIMAGLGWRVKHVQPK